MSKRQTAAKALRPNGRITPKVTRDSFANFQARLGYGSGNLTDGASYQVDYTSRNRQQLDAMYRSSWICGKAVDCAAEDMTKKGIEINSQMPPEEIDQLMAEWKRLKVWDRLCDSIKWSRLYGGALGVLLIDGQKMETPLRIETIGKDQFKGIHVLDRWLVNPSLTQLVKDLGPDMGLPEFYDVIADSQALQNMRIHYSRVIRIDGQTLPYFQRIGENLWGQSVLERLFDRLVAFDSTTAGTAQLVYKAHLRTYKVPGLREILAQGGPAMEGLLKQIEFIRSTQTNEGMTLMDGDDEFEAHSYTFSGLDTVLLQFAQQLSGALNIPLVRLFGQSPAGLNATGESDLVTYYDGINQEQELHLRTPITKLLAVSYQSKYGRPLPDGSDFTFRPLWQLTDAEKATVAATVTTAVTSALNAAVVGRKTALKELRQSSRITGVWSNITDEAIEAADDDAMSLGSELFGTGPLGSRSQSGDDDEASAESRQSTERDKPGSPVKQTPKPTAQSGRPTADAAKTRPAARRSLQS